MDRRKRTARTVALMSLFTMTDTQTDVPIASFDGDGSDLISLIVGIEPVQDLNGYDNPWPAGGGKNLLNVPQSVSLSGVGYLVNKVPINLPAGAYTLSFNCSSVGSNKRFQIVLRAGETPIFSRTGDIASTVTLSFTTTQAADHVEVFCNNSDAATYTNAMIESGSTTTAYAPYSNICPISGWTEAKIWVKSTHDTSATPTATIQLGETVYGGTLDVTTGKLTVDRANIASYNGETLTGRWISDRDVYSAGTTPTIGAQVVYELATSIVYDLTPTEINTLIGTNNIWADTGEIKYIEYNV